MYLLKNKLIYTKISSFIHSSKLLEIRFALESPIPNTLEFKILDYKYNNTCYFVTVTSVLIFYIHILFETQGKKVFDPFPLIQTHSNPFSNPHDPLI